MSPTVYQIPVCPFSQRLKILLALKGVPDAVDHPVVDITKPRPEELLRKSRGTTALPIMELPDGRVSRKAWCCCSATVCEKRLKLESAYVAWQLVQAKVACVPALHFVSPVIRADTIRAKK